MRTAFVAFLSLLAINYLNAQELHVEKVDPHFLSFSYKGDFMDNARGGLKQKVDYLGIAALSLDLKTEFLHWGKGGVFHLNLANTHGGIPSCTVVGDYLGVSNIEAGNKVFFQELWYEQNISKFDLKFGIQDLNAEFSSNEVGALFINSSFGIQSTFTDNLAASLFPIMGFGAVFKYHINDTHVVHAGIFDGNPEMLSFYPSNYRLPFSGGDGIMAIAEYGYNKGIGVDCKGYYKFGFYYHNHTLLHDSESNCDHYGDNYGIYFVGNQRLVGCAESKSHLDAFVQLSFSPININSNHLFCGAGLVYAGLFKESGSDELGLACGYARFDKKHFSNEKVIELSYKYPIWEYHIYLQPDMQLVINPSRFDLPLKNALVATVRVGVNI